MARTSALSKRGKTVDPTIEAARLTVMGTILVALISSPILTKVVEAALTVVPAAQAAPVSPTAPAATARPETATPTVQLQPAVIVPTATPQDTDVVESQPVAELSTAEPMLPLVAGEDWQTCVDATLWQAYPTVATTAYAGHDCLNLLENGIYTEQGDLWFYNAGRVDYDLYGISTPITAEAVVEFTVTIDELQSDQVWVGFTENANPWNWAWFLVFKPGGYIDIREVSGTAPNPVLRNYAVPAENNEFHVRIEVTGNRPTVFVNEVRLTPNGVVRFTERNLFFGYMTVAGPEIAIAAHISNLNIENK